MSLYSNPNGFPMANGMVLHMDLRKGDLANRIVTVGSESRARKFARYFDSEPRSILSHRGFLTLTGTVKGVEVSVVAIGMGVSMMDFFVREARAIVDGPMAIVRYGTCGGLSAEAVPGTVVVASKGSGYIARNPDAFTHLYSDSDDVSPPNTPAYHFYKVAPADPTLSALVTTELGAALGEDKIVQGQNVTADSFYSSQGRLDDRFVDFNESLTSKDVYSHYPEAASMEMESFVLLQLARCCKVPIKAAATAMVVANRMTSVVVADDVLVDMEEKGALAVLTAVVKMQI